MNPEKDDSADAPDEDVERARINSETAKIAWTELQRFFAKGLTVCVYPALDLVDVAYQVSIDNKETVEPWMESGHLGPVSDSQAREWLEANALMWAVVVKPWVLVQPILKDPDPGTRKDLN